MSKNIKVTAVHTIIRTNEDDDRVSIQPGDSFNCPEDEAKKLLAKGAVKEAKGAKKADVKETDTTETAPKEKALRDMNKAELLAKAEEVGVEADETMTKKQLVTAIESYLEGASEADKE